MLTINYKDLQYRHSKPKKGKKQSQFIINEQYSLTKSNFTVSEWKDYKEWLKEQRQKEKLQKKAQEPSKKKKGKTTKVNKRKATGEHKKTIDNKTIYKQQLEHPLWAKKRKTILERDNHTCQLCGSKEHLHIHHTIYKKGNKAWEYSNSVLITLCEECHKKVHSDMHHELNPYRK